MKKNKLLKSFILYSLFLIFLPHIALSETERRIALVIGNSEYKSTPLRNPANDATDIADALKTLDFQSFLKPTPTREKWKTPSGNLDKT